MAQREVSKWILKREAWLAEHAPKASWRKGQAQRDSEDQVISDASRRWGRMSPSRGQLVPRHGDFDRLVQGQSSSGKPFGSTSSSMLRGVLGFLLMNPPRSSVSTIW